VYKLCRDLLSSDNRWGRRTSSKGGGEVGGKRQFAEGLHGHSGGEFGGKRI